MILISVDNSAYGQGVEKDEVQDWLGSASYTSWKSKVVKMTLDIGFKKNNTNYIEINQWYVPRVLQLAVFTNGAISGPVNVNKGCVQQHL